MISVMTVMSRRILEPYVNGVEFFGARCVRRNPLVQLFLPLLECGVAVLHGFLTVALSAQPREGQKIVRVFREEPMELGVNAEGSKPLDPIVG